MRQHAAMSRPSGYISLEEHWTVIAQQREQIEALRKALEWALKQIPKSARYGGTMGISAVNKALRNPHSNQRGEPPHA